jgi:hypothetical protein
MMLHDAIGYTMRVVPSAEYDVLGYVTPRAT